LAEEDIPKEEIMPTNADAKPASSQTLSLEKLWEIEHFHPNEAQESAIRHVDGPLYLTAGPGSGKTRVLLWRTLNLIVFNDVKPEEIFLSTFTEKAALQLKEGLRSLLGIVTNLNGQPYDLSSMYVGTVHSLCQRMLSDRRHFVVDRHRQRPPQLLDELGQYFHLSRNRHWRAITQQAGLDENANVTINSIWNIPSESKHKAVVNCQAIFNRFSEECIDPNHASHKLESKNRAMQAHFEHYGLVPEQVALLLRLYAAYRDSLQISPNARLTDFALLQQEAINVLNEYDRSDSVFKHVIVDEYQDTNTIQESIFFKLAEGHKNICVVGDDDQALYRFRGATVENFVEFPTRCKQHLGQSPRRISLATNYRSRKRIVDFYSAFVRQIDWSRPSGGAYRVTDKDIQPFKKDNHLSVVASTPTSPDIVCREIAQLVKALLDEGKVENANQIAFLFPSLKYEGDMVASVRRMKETLEAIGLKVYAPRAGRFLEVDESFDVLGLLIQILGRPPAAEFHGRDYEKFQAWVNLAEQTGQELMKNDPLLKKYVNDRREELENARNDYQILTALIERNRWNPNDPYKPDLMKRGLYGAGGLSEHGKKLVASVYLDRMAKERLERGQPLPLSNILKRMTSIDWNLLDIFYQMCGFQHFKAMFDAAERHRDEGPVANLGLITQYLSRFTEERVPLISADLLVDKILQQVFFSYLFALYRLGETELEDAEDPFPKGRIPFLTIHQAKGLEFPVVVLGNPRKDNRGPNRIEQITRPLMAKEPGEPLERMASFDIMRMFYVALSRPKNLLVIAHYRGAGQRMNAEFQTLLDDDFPRIPDLKIGSLPRAELKEDTLPKSYSFTSDFIAYKKCPRQYMIFRKFGFVPSRSQMMFFGSLVHQTLEDLHHELIQRRSQP
jgi:DNA helicase-2/ATP-dependent DNA helicase PcrA